MRLLLLFALLCGGCTGPDVTGSFARDEPEGNEPVTSGDDVGPYVTVRVLVPGGWTSGVRATGDFGEVELSLVGEGVFAGPIRAETSSTLRWRTVQDVAGEDRLEDVPDACSDGGFRAVTVGDEDVVLDVVPFGGCAGDSVNAGVCALQPGRSEPLVVRGAAVVEAGRSMHFKGVAWSPTPLGGAPWAGGADYAGTVVEDAALMENAGIRAVRTYGPILDVTVLDALWAEGIGVFMTVFYGYDETPDDAVADLCAVKEHPAVLAWLVGNEWNYNNLGRPTDFIGARDTVAEVARALRLNDATRPVSTVYGGLPDVDTIATIDAVDLWGLNIYTGESFQGTFDDWASRSSGPMYFAEYGADAYSRVLGRVDEATQADIVESLTEEIHARASVNGGQCIGGMLFEFNDEWWKYGGGSEWEHDTDSSWDNGGYPDPGMHEEWWGIVDIDRTTREAYGAYAALPSP